MLRTFSEHRIRTEEPLDGLWDFVTQCERNDKHELPRAYTRKASVPSAWESLPGLNDYRGKGWYRRSIVLEQEANVRLVFGGVSHTAVVYLDGLPVGHHYDAFTPWAVLVPAVAAGRHELVVEVDNTFGEHSALHKENDYYTYGGITRPVSMQIVPDLFVDNLRAIPQKKGRIWSLDVQVRFRNCGQRAKNADVSVLLDAKTFDLGTVTIPAKTTGQLSKTLNKLPVEPWSPEEPNLYFVQVTMTNADLQTDDLIDRIGFREFKTRGRKLVLNGRPVRLRGYNRHEDHPQFGNALPLTAQFADLQIMRDLNCNFVRTSHYPNDMRFLDLCDELGFFVWEESHARAIPFDHPRFREQMAENTREMIEWHANHPSIVMWGCLNECDSVSEEGRVEHLRIIELIKQLDSSRPVTFASNKRERDICLDAVDIVSWNRYHGWYSGDLSNIEEELNESIKWLDSPGSGGAGKPVIISEFGAGAIYGCRQPHRAKWSEEYQADLLDKSLEIFLNHPRISGTTIWQFCDVRVTFGWFGSRPRSMNNKGTVDEYRRPKAAYESVKLRMAEAVDKWEHDR